MTHPTPDTDERTCPFCTRPALHTTTHALLHADAYPLTPGHLLVTPRRHAPLLTDLTPDETADIWNLVTTILAAAPDTLAALHPDLADSPPAGWNLGMNAGTAAGQTIGHTHLHLIPRRTGDMPDPRGGVRWTIPDKARYW